MRQPHQYRDLDLERKEELMSNYLIDKWRFSMVSAFSRNEKAFEMSYIYGCDYKSSSSTIAGSAYHLAVQNYFSYKKDAGEILDIVSLERIAFEYIYDVPANKWKIQKTIPTIEKCIEKALKTTSSLLLNFISEIHNYEDDVAEILEVEYSCYEYLTINGVDIPVPCSGTMDLVLKLKNGRVVIVDHKTRSAFTSEEDMSMTIGKQAITYVCLYEARTDVTIDEIWFIENKHSKNTSGGNQLNKFIVDVTDDTRKLYEFHLYIPLKRMLEAVSNPDYNYMINDSDKFVDIAELYQFDARTMIGEIDDFSIQEGKKDLIAKRLKKIKDASIAAISPSVIKSFKEHAASFIDYDLSNKNMTQEEIIEHTLRQHGIMVRVAHKFNGYSSNTYLLEFAPGVKITSIYKHRLDIANQLNVSNVRMSSELTVYEGKSYLAIDFSKKRERDLIFEKTERNGLKIPLGKDNFESNIIWDLENDSTPHVLVCGATGSGKSVCLESTIEYAKDSEVEEIYIFCRKKDFNHLHDHNKVFVYNNIDEIEEQVKNLVLEMNALIDSGREKLIMVIFDEYADAILSSRSGKELDIIENVEVGRYAPKKGLFGIMEPGAPKMALKKTGKHKSISENLQALLQTGRSSGFRILCATQRASVKVIQGDTKVNFPVRICFRVPTKTDSKVILDEDGAEALTGKGDGLISSPEYNQVTRFQAYYKP